MLKILDRIILSDVDARRGVCAWTVAESNVSMSISEDSNGYIFVSVVLAP